MYVICALQWCWYRLMFFWVDGCDGWPTVMGGDWRLVWVVGIHASGAPGV